METIIQDKLRPIPDEQSVTALSLLRAIVDTFTELAHIDLSGHMDKLSSKLIMCLCHAELLAAPVCTTSLFVCLNVYQNGVTHIIFIHGFLFQMVMIALAVFNAHLQLLGMDNVQAVAFTTILNVCQVSISNPGSLLVSQTLGFTIIILIVLQIYDRDFLPYQEHISQFLTENYAAPSSLPKLPLKWKISNRTMWVLRPHYRWAYDLPSIPEMPIESLDMRYTILTPS